jgi:hypothetical protein
MKKDISRVKLTEMELHIIGLVVEGKDNKDIQLAVYAHYVVKYIFILKAVPPLLS